MRTPRDIPTDNGIFRAYWRPYPHKRGYATATPYIGFFIDPPKRTWRRIYKLNGRHCLLAADHTPTFLPSPTDH